MVPVALALMIELSRLGFDSVAVKVSLPSTRSSTVVCTVKVFEVSPCAKLSVPLVAVKSPDDAVSPLPIEVA